MAICGLLDSSLSSALVHHHHFTSLVTYIMVIISISILGIQATLKYCSISHKFSSFLAFWLLLNPFGSWTWALEGASILEIEPCNTTFLRIVMTSLKDYIMDEKSSIKVLTSTFNILLYPLWICHGTLRNFVAQGFLS